MLAEGLRLTLSRAHTTARKKWGEEQVHIWRRSYDVPPPGGESLELTLKRVLPYYEKEIVPRVEKGEKVLIAAHGNSLRSIIKHLEGLSGEEIVKTELATGVPIVYKLDKNGAYNSLCCRFLGRLTGEPPSSQARSSRRPSSTTSPSRRAPSRSRRKRETPEACVPPTKILPFAPSVAASFRSRLVSSESVPRSSRVSASVSRALRAKERKRSQAAPKPKARQQ